MDSVRAGEVLKVDYEMPPSKSILGKVGSLVILFFYASFGQGFQPGESVVVRWRDAGEEAYRRDFRWDADGAALSLGAISRDLESLELQAFLDDYGMSARGMPGLLAATNDLREAREPD